MKEVVENPRCGFHNLYLVLRESGSEEFYESTYHDILWMRERGQGLYRLMRARADGDAEEVAG